MTVQIVRTPISIQEISAPPVRDIARAAWLISRPTANPVNAADEALLIDAPINDLPTFILHMRVPILFREIIFTMRDHHAWARTSRVDDLNVWPIWAGVDDIDMSHISVLAQDMTDLMSLGSGQDNYRSLLPMSYMTEFTIALSLRQAIRLLKYFDMISNYSAIREACSSFIDQLWQTLEFHGVQVGKLAYVYRLVDFCPPLTPTVSGGRGRIGETIVVKVVRPMMLRAQVIRHGELSVVDNMFDFIKSPRVFSIPVSALIYMEISANSHVWRGLISQRNCWLAHADLWEPIVSQVNNYMTSDFALPCSNGVCPYDGDCKQRLFGTDPGVPCPRHLNLAHGDLMKEVREKLNVEEISDKMRDYMEGSARNEEFWLTEITRVSNGSSAQ